MSCHVNNVQSQQGHQTISNISLQFSACFFWCFGPKSPLSSVWRHPAIEKLLLSFGAKPGSKLPEPPGMNTYGALGRVGERHDNRNGDWKKYATYLDIIYLDHSLFFFELSWSILIYFDWSWEMMVSYSQNMGAWTLFDGPSPRSFGRREPAPEPLFRRASRWRFGILFSPHPFAGEFSLVCALENLHMVSYI